jgi:hypothetical protein
MLIGGKCHCGNISFSLAWEPDPVRIQARVCTCSFCSKHAGVWTSSPEAALRVAVSDPALVSRYAFGSGNASFHVCARCGIVPVVTARLGGTLYGVVSVNAFEHIDRSLIQCESSNFDAEDSEARLARWKRNWIANVEYIEAGGARFPASS